MTGRFHPWAGIVLALVLLLAAGLLLAQDDDEDEDAPRDCSEAGIVIALRDLTMQIDDFTAMIAEDRDAALAALYEVGAAYQALAFDCGYIPPDVGDLTVGTDVVRILEILAQTPGDPINGQLLYNNEANAADGSVLGCVGCHNNADSAPLTAGTWTRWDEIRSELPQFADYTFEQYMVESIVHPWDYLVPGYGETMPPNFGDRISFQDLADIVAYLFGQDQLIE